MLSVYHHSLGQLEVRGAPAAMVPSEVRPMDLDEALDVLEDHPDLLRNAVWRMIRSVPVARDGEVSLRRYPRELAEFVSRGELAILDRKRREYRKGTLLVAAALSACADEDWDLATELAELLKRGASATGPSISNATTSRLGMSAPEFLGALNSTDKDQRKRFSGQLARLEDEVGLSLRDFVEDFADTAAFADFVPESEKLRPRDGDDFNVYPVCSAIRQSTRTLATSATITTIVNAPFDVLKPAIHPLSWPKGNDVVQRTAFVNGPFDLTESTSDQRFLYEDAHLTWGGDPDRRARFENVLNVRTSIRDEDRIDLEFSLSRSLKSRILWDNREGGILLDDGYIKARRLVGDRWRVTRRKVVKFSDRTPYANGRGWLDTGQLLNYLAPAGLIYWLENDIASLEVGG